jgi:hypothetical protein
LTVETGRLKLYLLKPKIEIFLNRNIHLSVGIVTKLKRLLDGAGKVPKIKKRLHHFGAKKEIDFLV